MAYHIVKNLLKSKEHDKFLVIMGKGHCEYGFGVPERVVDHISNVQDIILSVRDSNDYDMDD